MEKRHLISSKIVLKGVVLSDWYYIFTLEVYSSLTSSLCQSSFSVGSRGLVHISIPSPLCDLQ